MSARLSTARPLACSGAMYAAVPRIMPIAVIAGDVIVGEFRGSRVPGPESRVRSIAFANPKSNTFTVPSARTLMFCGFRSRCTIPCSCAASSASAICFAMASASESGMPPREFAGSKDPASVRNDPSVFGGRVFRPGEYEMISDRSCPSTSSMTSAVRSGVFSSP